MSFKAFGDYKIPYFCTKIGKTFISGDPHEMTANGKILFDMANRQNPKISLTTYSWFCENRLVV